MNPGRESSPLQLKDRREEEEPMEDKITVL
jgi:hypothetical protein